MKKFLLNPITYLISSIVVFLISFFSFIEEMKYFRFISLLISISVIIFATYSFTKKDRKKQDKIIFAISIFLALITLFLLFVFALSPDQEVTRWADL